MFQVGPFVFEPHTGALSRGDTKQQLEPQVSALLLMFCQRAGQLVTREQLLTELWPGRVVSDDALRAAIKKLRDALGDDARNPQYIKTLPMQGYTLIAATRQGPVSHHRAIKPKSLWAGAITVLLFTVGLWGWHKSQPEAQPITYTLEPLTQMNGSEVNPDYDPIHQRLVFAHRANQNDFLQLYSKDLRSGRLKRLTWDEANYVKARWSNDGSHLLFTRTTLSSNAHFISRYNNQKGIVNSMALDDPQLSDKYLLDWGHNNQQLYLVDAPAPAKPRGIWRYDIPTQRLEAMTTPQHGYGDYFAMASPDGEQLAVLRSVADNKRELIVIHLPTGSLRHTRILPEKMDRLVWSPDQTSLSLSNFRGDILTFRFADDTFTSIEMGQTGQSYLNHLFHQCGTHCFYLRAHNGNFLELAEQPNPFTPSAFTAMDYFEQRGAEDWPLYGAETGSMYFLHAEKQQNQLARIHPQQGYQVLHRLPDDSRIGSLSVNPQETHLIGLLNGRVFVFEINTSSLSFRSSAMETVYPPTWDEDGEALLFGKNERNGPVIVRTRLAETDTQVAEKGFVIVRPWGEAGSLRVDSESALWLYRENSPVRQLGRLPDISPNRWRVSGEWLYVTYHQENQAFMRRMHLIDERSEQVILARNRFRLNFDISEDGTRLAVVRSKLADSDLVKVSDSSL